MTQENLNRLSQINKAIESIDKDKSHASYEMAKIEAKNFDRMNFKDEDDFNNWLTDFKESHGVKTAPEPASKEEIDALVTDVLPDGFSREKVSKTNAMEANNANEIIKDVVNIIM